MEAGVTQKPAQGGPPPQEWRACTSGKTHWNLKRNKARRVVHPHMTMEGNSEENINYVSAPEGVRIPRRKGEEKGAGSWEPQGREEGSQG